MINDTNITEVIIEGLEEGKSTTSRLYSNFDMIRFVKFANQNKNLSPLDQLKKYNKTFPELSRFEKFKNVQKWIKNNL